MVQLLSLKHDVYPLEQFQRGSVVPHRYYWVSEVLSAHGLTSSVEEEVVGQQMEDDLAAWEVCAADLLQDQCLDLHFRHFDQVKGIGNDEEDHHRPLPVEWVEPHFQMVFHLALARLSE